VPHRFLALYFDFGDTLIDQATEVKDESLTTLHAELIPGVVELLHELKRRGYRLGLVSNGPVGSIPNVLGAYGLYELFDVLAVSQGLGVDKPDGRIFRYALDHLGIPQSGYERTIMVGNDLAADVAGANAVGYDQRLAGLDAASPQDPHQRNRDSTLHHCRTVSAAISHRRAGTATGATQTGDNLIRR
jgi:FMN phosphatase YigB (HAD superfamily)